MFGIKKMKKEIELLIGQVDILKEKYGSLKIDSSFVVDKLSEFRKSNSELTTQNKKLEDRLWLLENPPKYKVGQVVKGMIVTSVEVVKRSRRIFEYLERGVESKSTPQDLIEKAWQYKAIKKGMTEQIEIL